LMNISDTKTGVASTEVTVSTGGQDYTTITIGMEVKGYYTGNDASEDVVVNIAKSLGDFVTGGGYLVLASSTGQAAGDRDSKNNFGFNVKLNKNGNTVQGNFSTIIRRTEWNAKKSCNELHVYRVKTTSINMLSMPGATAGTPAKAIFTGKANIQDASNGDGPSFEKGNATIQVEMTDNGEPGSEDRIAITIWDRNGSLWFASNWNGVKTIDQQLAKGNLQVHSSASIKTPLITHEIPNSNEVIGGLAALRLLAYPNPSASYFTIELQGNQEQKIQMRVMDVSGRIIETFNNLSSGGRLQIGSGYRPGMYLLEIVQGNECKQVKLLKMSH